MKVTCPRCGRDLNVSQGVSGLQVRCPLCHEMLIWEGAGPACETASPTPAAPPASSAVHAKRAAKTVSPALGFGAPRGWRYVAAAAALAVVTFLSVVAGRLSGRIFESADLKPGPAIVADDTTGKFPGNRIQPFVLSYLTPMELHRSTQQPDVETIRALEQQHENQEREKKVLKEREKNIRYYDKLAAQAKAEEERRIAEEKAAEMRRQMEVYREERLKVQRERRREVVFKIETLKTEMSGLEREINDDQANWDGLYRNALYTKARAWEWYRQQFFDVQRQQDTLTIWNAPTFLWTPQVLEIRYGYEWRHFAELHSQAVALQRHAFGLAVQLSQKKQELAALEQEKTQIDQELNELSPDPRPVPGAAPDVAQPAPADVPLKNPPSDT